ncbi:MAG: Crp/Fnr family transcriptional regulator [Chitinophaga sp.]|uniref:Crp/Fnr family transcriptional regulator n=1 Tax=Chitinophaga sp. TaxID=1869181 RepID=UPI001B243856|nr:Crp/Fnr family transcriptional regulator [Chitinophaga sp.]MBO9731474.1 Crp/Fnr family transcriptional regulator [Chitinophaga sp.]
MNNFWEKVSKYHPLSAETRQAWENIIKSRTYKRHETLVAEGQVPRQVAFVVKGLFSQYYTAPNGDVVIKRFFPETFLAASVSAMLTKSPSQFTIRALENTTVLEYQFDEFKKLITIYPDLAALYIRYLEIHWVLEKEPQEISLRYDTAKSRYTAFLEQFPTLEPRLKQHEIASYLGITPTQLSRIRAER